jgi:hypothetical protein
MRPEANKVIIREFIGELGLELQLRKQLWAMVGLDDDATMAKRTHAIAAATVAL